MTNPRTGSDADTCPRCGAPIEAYGHYTDSAQGGVGRWIEDGRGCSNRCQLTDDDFD